MWWGSLAATEHMQMFNEVYARVTNAVYQYELYLCVDTSFEKKILYM